MSTFTVLSEQWASGSIKFIQDSSNSEYIFITQTCIPVHFYLAPFFFSPLLFLHPSLFHPSLSFSLPQTKGNSCVSLLVVAIICFIEHSVHCAQFTAISIKQRKGGGDIRGAANDSWRRKGRGERRGNAGPWGTETPLFPHPTCFSCSTAPMPPRLVAPCQFFFLLYFLLHLLHLLLGMLPPPSLLPLFLLLHLILFSTSALQTPTLNCDRWRAEGIHTNQWL